jgi:hypothetical protein
MPPGRWPLATGAAACVTRYRLDVPGLRPYAYGRTSRSWPPRATRARRGGAVRQAGPLPGVPGALPLPVRQQFATDVQRTGPRPDHGEQAVVKSFGRHPVSVTAVRRCGRDRKARPEDGNRRVAVAAVDQRPSAGSKIVAGRVPHRTREQERREGQGVGTGSAAGSRRVQDTDDRRRAARSTAKLSSGKGVVCEAAQMEVVSTYLSTRMPSMATGPRGPQYAGALDLPRPDQIGEHAACRDRR